MPLGLLQTVRGFRAEAPKPLQNEGGVPCAPPLTFRDAGEVRAAWPITTGPFGPASTRRGTPAQRQGLRYERKALDHLSATFGPAFVRHQWFEYQDKRGRRYCQTDGLLQTPLGAAIFEIKYSFTAEAHTQLRMLYAPVVRAAYHPARLALVIVCKNFDPAVQFPEPITHTDLQGDWAARLTNIGVFVWRP